MKTVLMLLMAAVTTAAGTHVARPQFAYAGATPETSVSNAVLANVEQAVLQYAAACAARDEKAMAEVLTSSAIIAYASSVPGTFVAGEASAGKCWAEDALAGSAPNESPIRIYPTNEPNEVFIQYTSIRRTGRSQTAVQDVALVEMAGNRIAQIRDFSLAADIER